jgi:uncharacterized protein YndB with AHSA1/START domain
VIRFSTSVRIERPVDRVFAAIADPERYPDWNSAVRRVTPIDEDAGRFRMERELPSGPATNLLEIVEEAPPEELVIRASEGPTPFTYRYRLHGTNGATELSLEAEVELGGLAGRLGPIAELAVRRGVDENFAQLKRSLE